MSDVIPKQSPLVAFDEQQHVVDGSSPVLITEYPFQGYHNLRLDIEAIAETSRSSDNVEIAGIKLPLVPNRVIHNLDGDNTVTAYWLGPDEWLMANVDENTVDQFDAMEHALTNSFHSLTNISSAMTRIHLGGDCAVEILSQGTTFDIDERSFTVDACAQTMLAKSSVLIARATSGFDLLVRRSFADYLLRWLLDAAHHTGFEFRRASR
ncbi:MAG: sarcosine oxidase subunit gamma [marine bacterium B5-7]|nr:MAG: sarcosine oxidase subunit gamma [marine bacterium B5-7]